MVWSTNAETVVAFPRAALIAQLKLLGGKVFLKVVHFQLKGANTAPDHLLSLGHNWALWQLMPRVSVLCLNQALVPPHRREDLAGVSLFNLIIQWFYHFSGISFLYFFCNTGEPQADNSSLATHAFAKAPNDMHVSSHLVSPTVFTVSLTAWSDSMCLIIQPSSLLSLWCLRVVSEASGRQLVKQENLCFLFFYS